LSKKERIKEFGTTYMSFLDRDGEEEEDFDAVTVHLQTNF
jgi:hypothetical protein